MLSSVRPWKCILSLEPRPTADIPGPHVVPHLPAIYSRGGREAQRSPPGGSYSSRVDPASHYAVVGGRAAPAAGGEIRKYIVNTRFLFVCDPATSQLHSL